MSEQDTHNYAKIQPQEFKSTIPPHLIEKLSDGERYLVATMSRLENQSTWSVSAIVQNNADVRHCDQRVTAVEEWKQKLEMRVAATEKQASDQGTKVDKLWDWKQYFSGKWAVLAVLVLALMQALLKLVLDHLWKK